jgi:hypothetical protein
MSGRTVDLWTKKDQEARGGDEAAGNRQAPLPRTLATGLGYSSRTRARARRKKVDTTTVYLNVGARCHACHDS